MCNYQRPLLAAGSLMWVTMILGCMSLCIGKCHDAVQPDGTICQKGETQVSSGDVQIVYYPVPYASPRARPASIGSKASSKIAL